MEEQLPWETDCRESSAPRGPGGRGRAEAESIPRTPARAPKATIGSVRVATFVLGFFVAPKGTRTGPRGPWPRS